MTMNKPAQIELIDPKTGEHIEPVDIRTRSDLVRHNEGTVEEALNNIEDKVLELSMHANYKEMSIQGSWSHCYDMGSAHTIHYDITRGTLSIESIIVSINGQEQRVSEVNIATLNETGKLRLEIEVNSSIARDIHVNVDVYDVEGGWGNANDKIKFRYPSYTTVIIGKTDTSMTDIVKSGKKLNYDEFSACADAESINDEMYRMVVAVQADRTLESVKLTGVPFNMINAMNKDRVFIECSDGTTQTYNVFYSNEMTSPPLGIDRWEFKLEEED